MSNQRIADQHWDRSSIVACVGCGDVFDQDWNELDENELCHECQQRIYDDNENEQNRSADMVMRARDVRAG